MDRILLIDDNPAILSMLQQHLLLRARRSEIHCAVDRGEAEALIGSYTYSLVIADLALDKYSLEGLAIIRHLHYLPLRPKIIVFTGCVTPELEAEARREGADAVVSKGSSLAGLTRLIDQLMSCELAEVSVQQSAPSALWTKLLSEGGVTSVGQPIFTIKEDTAKIFAVEFLSRGLRGTPFERRHSVCLCTRPESRRRFG